MPASTSIDAWPRSPSTAVPHPEPRPGRDRNARHPPDQRRHPELDPDPVPVRYRGVPSQRLRQRRPSRALAVSAHIRCSSPSPRGDPGAPERVTREGELRKQEGDKDERRDRSDQLDRCLTLVAVLPLHAANVGGPIARVAR